MALIKYIIIIYMGNLLNQMLQPGSSIRTSVPQSPQGQMIGDTGQDSGMQVLDTVKTAASIAAMFL